MDVQIESPLKGVLSSLDLSHCGSEPIHIPGVIQPHGAVLAALADGLIVSHASANLAAILGRAVQSVLGRSLENAIGEPACRALLDAAPGGWVKPEQVHSLSLPDGRMLYLRAYRTGRHICVDIEPLRFESLQNRPIFMARSIVRTFERAASVVELCELAVQGMKAISGYARVMAYRFFEDGHGEVIAEAREASLNSYLGQHYPASDSPPQARRLYLRQRVGAIANSSYIPVPLVADRTLDDGTPLDLTHSALRSASPIHCECMRNMDAAASLTIGLGFGPDLWGMLVCHDAKPRCAGFELRAAADLIGLVVSLLLVALEQMERVAATDGLTGLANRRHFHDVADKEWRRCGREDQPLSVLLLDADHFKLFNDNYGHLAGDDCLRAIASQVAAAARRPGDLAARYGGEEFLLLMPRTDRDNAMRVAERIRVLVLDLAMAHEGRAAPGVVSVSIGAATAWPANANSGLSSVSALLAAADTALYQAKSGGRNRVVIAGL